MSERIWDGLRKNALYKSTYILDTIRYDTVDLRALKSWRDGQLNLAHGPETKNNKDELMKVWRLGSYENVVGKWEELVFDAFSDQFRAYFTVAKR